MGNTGIYVGLDIGTTSIKVIVAEYVKGQMNVIGVGSERSEGLSRGVVVDIDKAVAAIQNAVRQAEQRAEIEIHEVTAGIPANLLEIEPCQGMIAVADESKEINDSDVRNVAAAALVRNLPPEREILTIIPDEFIVDGFDGIKDPRGMIGVRLEMHGILLTAPKTVIHNMQKCIERAGLVLNELVVNPLSLGKLALADGEQDFGTVLIDLGGGQSTAAVIHDHKLKYTYVDQEGGDYITKDISVVLNTSFDSAEKVKRDYGYADSLQASSEEDFPVEVVGKDAPITVNEKYLAEIIEARLTQIFEKMNQALRKVGALDLPGGIVMTGGVTALPGIVELASDIFDHNVKLYIPDEMGLRHPSFAQALSLISYTANLSEIDLIVQSTLKGTNTTKGNYTSRKVVKTDSEQFRPANNQTTTQNEASEPKKERFASIKKFISNFFE
ncbi:cell division protein FtsA [Loigolactobacillus coryniformis]|jgi:cell division protein FtsA|uniref:Cell division protein FtsA n=3 Tax=Loigolactobacillus coryniformis TaxID=1610 RepID=J3JC95_9LACO|nr:cell division protein FtsA [Loigolactobacillus coryniformis]MDT3391696.1 cell division protein FtsA [Bacillota bacterium]OEH89751.1 cell division protein FtsA [Loigolactobacillus coryniformis subsp. coryniformis]ATO43577.1 cell division protein FtsA [Loigolactobacillus coryniformis subsp. torquens DSM 20004 = KCTC 3535]ATO55257.1 cell division protein FtsA [Loigolactobacillus coryniformis subsp. coryniformis KCTC 3167 = DSM 20001]EJN56402.1 Cell division protein ftsA [Loigolactobacillus cor